MRPPPVRFLAPRGFPAHRLARMLHSLVRVSRRAHRRPSAGIMGALLARVPLGRPDTSTGRTAAGETAQGVPFLPPARSMPARPRQTPAPGRGRAIPRAAVTSHAFPPNNFKHFLTLFSKFFSSFPHGTCSLSGSHQYLALDGIYHPLFAAFPNNKTRRRRSVQRAGRRRRGSHPLGRPFPGDLGAGARRRRLDRPQFSGRGGRRFSAWADPGSLAVTRGILVSFFSSAY